MRDVHTIRLRGPWQLEPLARFARDADGQLAERVEELPPGARAKMPDDWSTVLGEDFFGRVAYRRTFHKPGGLEDLEQVWLVVEPPRSRGSIRLNGELLGEVGQSPFRQEIAARLADTNRLEIVVEHPPIDTPQPAADDGPGGLIGEVRLEIGFP